MLKDMMWIRRLVKRRREGGTDKPVNGWAKKDWADLEDKSSMSDYKFKIDLKKGYV